ncbi:glycosyltransferase [Gracilimonas sp. Q87]|uniref:glycosyltransferase n=1 Tax=Gracilimonas sp. Q87 TaxID=3384766 RepID=UPI0039845A8F
MNKDLNITFIICTYNRAAYLDDTLHSMLQQNFNEGSVEILVVDNNSEDDTDVIVKNFMDRDASSRITISYCLEKEKGLSHARNRGINEAKTDNLVFIDDDILATKGFISNWLSFFQNYGEFNAAGGKIHVQFDESKPKWASHFLLSLFGHHNLGNKIKSYPPNKYPFGGNMGFRRHIFSKAGKFNTDLGRKGKKLTANEEKDLFNRIKALDEPILYLPDAALYHRIGEERATKEYIRKQAEGMGRSISTQVQGSSKRKVKHFLTEIFKTSVSLGLFVVYLFGFSPSKGFMLLKFRYWILQGYLSGSGKI